MCATILPNHLLYNFMQAYTTILHYIAGFPACQVFYGHLLLFFIEYEVMIKNSSMGEIARIAGVSISTVSRVLNEKPGISPETRKRVLDIYKDIITSSGITDRHPITGKTHTIGQVLHRKYLSTEYYTSFQNTIGIHEIAQRVGYHLLTALITDEDMDKELQLPMIKEKKVDGIIFMGSQIESSFIHDAAKSGIPIVLIDNKLKEKELDCVLDENEGSVYELTQHLIQKHNHSNIVFLSGPKAWISSRERETGYRLAMEKASLQSKIIYMPENTLESGFNAMKKVVEGFPEITAVVAVNDSVAMGSIYACREMGYPVPGKIAVVGFGDTACANLFSPPLTTVQTYAEEIGKKAAARLIDLIESEADREHIPLTLRLPSRMIFRGSCGCTS